MKPNELIRSRRMALGLKEADVATATSLKNMEYRDIEQHEDEAFTVTPLRALRAICKFLDLDLFSLFRIDCPFCSGKGADAEAFGVPRNILISERRKALGFTREQLGDLIGFETIAIREMEKDQDYLERWPVELIQQLAAHLQVTTPALLRVTCLKCGRGAK